jgi:hypothetical protein
MEKQVLIKLTFKDLAWIFSLVFLIGVSFYVVYVDYNTSYNWVFPLNKPVLANEWYPKSTIGVGVIDLQSNITILTLYKGLTTSVILDEYPSGYAVVVARGYNYYVVALTVFSTVFYALISRLLMRRIRTVSRIPLLFVLGFFFITLATIISLVPYINVGHELGYVYRTSKIVRELNSLNFTSLKEPFLNTLGYAYLFRDSFSTVTLVNAELRVKNVLVIMVLNRTGIPEVTYNTAFYEAPGKQLMIYLFSSTPNPVGTFSYLRIEFTPRSTYPQTAFMTPLILCLATLVWGLTSVFIMRRFTRRL